MKLKKKVSLVILCVMVMALWTPINANAATTDIPSTSTFTPIHNYNFDRDDGTTVSDNVSTGAVNGTITGATKVTGYNGTGSAMHFDGNSFISFNDKIIPTGKKTISFMIRKASKPATATQFCFSNYMTTASQYGVRAQVDAEGRIAISSDNEGTVWDVRSSINICDNEWHKIVYTWDGTTNSNTAKMYVDDMTTPNNIATSTFQEVNSASLNLYIGTNSGGSTNYVYNFVGDIDDFNVYSEMYLNAPATVTGSAIKADKQIKVSWAAVPGATSYNVYRSETKGSGYTKMGSSNDLSFLDTDTTIVTNKTYYYVVTAVNSDFESAYSSDASVTLTEDTQSGNKAILEVTMTNGIIKEYDLTATELESFLTWYDNRSDGTGKSYYCIPKTSNVKPFLSRKEYLSYDKISSFEIKDYNE